MEIILKLTLPILKSFTRKLERVKLDLFDLLSYYNLSLFDIYSSIDTEQNGFLNESSIKKYLIRNTYKIDFSYFELIRRLVSYYSSNKYLSFNK